MVQPLEVKPHIGLLAVGAERTDIRRVREPQLEVPALRRSNGFEYHSLVMIECSNQFIDIGRPRDPEKGLVVELIEECHLKNVLVGGECGFESSASVS